MEWNGMAIAKEESPMKIRKISGFTLIELLVAIALGMVILAGVFRVFNVQQDAYVVQDQVAAMQQNLRAAMYMITRDLQMAGWYTNFDRNNRTINLGDLPTKTGRPLLFSANNGEGGNINPGTDALVILKAAEGSLYTLTGTETASGTSTSVNLTPSGLDPANNRYGVLVKHDLRTADFFTLTAPGTVSTLAENYQGDADASKADMLFRTDIIVYKIKNDPVSGRPTLYRDNLGNSIFDQAVAENIENMQVRYQLTSGSWENALTTSKPSQQVRAIEVILVGRTAFPQRGFRDTETYSFADNPNTNPNPSYRRKILSTIVKTRNVGLSS
jgi:prepilin-type N-terminal cleavage/methylation domain-containing protein